MDLSAAYDTVNHRVLLTKLYGMTEDAEFTKLIGSMMRNRRFYIKLNGKKSRWHNQNNGLPQGSVLSRRQEAQLILFYKLNSLAQVPFEGVLVEVYKGTRRKLNMKFRQIGHTTSQYGQSFSLKLLVHGMGLLSLKLHH